MTIIETKVYTFEELSDGAKERAREWWRNGSHDDTYGSEFVIDDAECIADLMGIEFKKQTRNSLKGKTYTETCVWWSGFSSQGDGACFEGTWWASNLKPGGVRDHVGQDPEMWRIADEFERLAKLFPHSSFKVQHRGHYSHRYCTDFTVSILDGEDNEKIGRAHV